MNTVYHILRQFTRCFLQFISFFGKNQRTGYRYTFIKKMQTECETAVNFL